MNLIKEYLLGQFTKIDQEYRDIHDLYTEKQGRYDSLVKELISLEITINELKSQLEERSKTREKFQDLLSEIDNT